MRRIIIGWALLLIGFYCIGQSSAYWQSRDSNYNISVAGGACSTTFPSGIGAVSHWRADVGVTTSGSNVTAVADQIASNNLANVNGSVPFSATGSAHGQPAFGFIAANFAALQTTTLNLGTGTTQAWVLVVGQMLTGTPFSFGGAVAMGTGSNSDFSSTTGVSWIGRENTSNGIETTQNTTNDFSNAVSLATQYRWLVQIDGATGVQYINNVAGSNTGSGGSLSTTSPITLLIGNRFISGSVSSNSWEGPISDVAIGTGLLSSANRNALDSYATCNWGT